MNTVFWNLTNHASGRVWSDDQTRTACRWEGIDREIRDFPFPSVPPEADRQAILRMGTDIVRSLIDLGAQRGDPVLVMGEFSLVHCLVNLLQAKGLVPLTATSRREAVETLQPDGSVTMAHRFRFVRFRPY